MIYLANNNTNLGVCHYSESQAERLGLVASPKELGGKKVQVYNIAENPNSFGIQKANDLLAQRSRVIKSLVISLLIAVGGFFLSIVPIIGVLGTIALFGGLINSSLKIAQWISTRREFNQQMDILTGKNEFKDRIEN